MNTDKIAAESRYAIEIMPRSRSDYSERVERIIKAAIEKAWDDGRNAGYINGYLDHKEGRTSMPEHIRAAHAREQPQTTGEYMQAEQNMSAARASEKLRPTTQCENEMRFP